MDMLKAITLNSGVRLEAGVGDVLTIGKVGECYTVTKRNRIGEKTQALYYGREVAAWTH
jgi:hypothetical protein